MKRTFSSDGFPIIQALLFVCLLGGMGACSTYRVRTSLKNCRMETYFGTVHSKWADFSFTETHYSSPLYFGESKASMDLCALMDRQNMLEWDWSNQSEVAQVEIVSTYTWKDVLFNLIPGLGRRTFLVKGQFVKKGREGGPVNTFINIRANLKKREDLQKNSSDIHEPHPW